MTGTRQDPSLVSQLRKEIATANQVDVLCSFIKWSGVRILEDSLEKLAANRSPLRVITTSYMGATDLKAVEALQRIPNTNVKVSYDTRRTRLHAKAYIIHRKTGFGVAYIGSSNISQAALTDGLEWNVKISQHESPHLWAKVCATFETYWNDPEFVAYSEASREQLRVALQQERAGTGSEEETAFFFDIKPYTYQEEILQRLQAEREVHGRHRNLVVAATGTGKTVVGCGPCHRLIAAEFLDQTEGIPETPVASGEKTS
jgi:HKD family nuclease